MSFNAHEPKNGDFATYVEKLAEIPAKKMQIIQVNASSSAATDPTPPGKLSKEKALELLRKLEQQKRRKKVSDSTETDMPDTPRSGFTQTAVRWAGSLILVLGWVWNLIPLPILIFALVILAMLTRQKKDS
ncbi:MAG: hypothetical protein ACOVML_03945 [Burkholderiaceae bacterium]